MKKSTRSKFCAFVAVCAMILPAVICDPPGEGGIDNTPGLTEASSEVVGKGKCESVYNFSSGTFDYICTTSSELTGEK